MNHGHEATVSPPGLLWEARQARVTVFPCAVAQYDNKWFEAITGIPPVREVTQRDQQVHEAVGPFGDGQLEIAAEADRVHFRYVPPESPDVLMATLGAPSSVAPALVERIVSLLVDEPVIIVRRVAVGIVAVVRVQTRQEAYQYLAQLLPSVSIDAEGTRDFLYQINRPRQISVDGLSTTVNRLSRWSVATVVRLTVTAPASVPIQTSQRAKEEMILQAEIDVNSDADRTDPIPPRNCRALIQSFCGLALEILNKGDLP